MKTLEALRSADQELQGVQSENRLLKGQKDKNESSTRQLEKEFDQISKQEKQMREDWNKRVNELEKSILEKKNLIHSLIASLSTIN